MKYLIVVLVVVLVIWLARRAREPDEAPPARPGRKPPDRRIEDMVHCEVCGLVMPRGDALPGRGGHYCGEAHRAEHERRHPVR